MVYYWGSAIFIARLITCQFKLKEEIPNLNINISTFHVKSWGPGASWLVLFFACGKALATKALGIAAILGFESQAQD